MSWLADNWPMVIGFAGGLVAWGKNTNDVAQAKLDIAENQADIKEALANISSMKNSIGQIEIHQNYMRQGIDDIKRALKNEL